MGAEAHPGSFITQPQNNLFPEARTWLLRWDTNRECPEVFIPAACSPEILPQNERHGFFRLNTGPQEESIVLFSGYLFDKTEYLNDPGAADADCVAAAYARYGVDLFDRLRGGFSLAIWDAQQRRLIAGRDGMGLQPCYYFWDGRLLLLSPEIDMILSQPEVRIRFNRVTLAEYLQGIWHAHQRHETFYENIQRLPAAHWLSLSEKQLRLERYWDPLPPGYQWASQEELETFQPLLERAVERCLAAGADSIALSGGFDSVSIAVLATDQLRGLRPIHAISLRFTLGSVDEGEVQLAVARALGMPQVMRSTDECLHGFPFVDASLALSRTSPSPVLSLWQSMYSGLLESAAELGLGKLLMGTGGDEMFGVDLSYGADRLVALDLKGFWRFYRAMERSSPFSSLRVAKVVFWDYGTKPAAARQLRRALELASPRFTDRVRSRHLGVKPWVAAGDLALREILIDRRLHYPEESDEQGEDTYLRKIRALVQSPLLMTELEQGVSWARHAGFTLMLPYFDREMVSLSLRMHPEFLISGGRAKTPLRRMVAERLAHVTLPSKKVDFTVPVHELLRQHGREVWQKMRGPQMLAELDLVAPEKLNPLMEAYFAGENNNWLRTWSVLSTESWLRARRET